MPRDETRTVLVIMGMRDNSCRERLCDALARLDGVTDVDVSLIRAHATIVHRPRCSRAQLVWAVVSEGYGVAMHGAPARDARAIDQP